jgi:hypothetical protein
MIRNLIFKNKNKNKQIHNNLYKYSENSDRVDLSQRSISLLHNSDPLSSWIILLEPSFTEPPQKLNNFLGASTISKEILH